MTKENEEILAEWMHNQYEEISKQMRWETQKKCQVKFKDLPEENKKVMIALAKRLIKKKGLKLVAYVCPMCNYEHEKKEDAINCCAGKE